MKKMQICNLIREARELEGLSREALAERVGVSSTTVMRWEKAANRPFFEEIVKLADILKKPISYFAGNDSQTTYREVTAGLPHIFHTLAEHSELIELMSQLPADDESFIIFKEMLSRKVKASSQDSKKKA